MKTKRPDLYPPDEVRYLDADEIAALPGMLGRIAPVMIARNGYYSYTNFETGRKVQLWPKEASK